MTYQPTRETLELAALAGGVALNLDSGAPNLCVFYRKVKKGSDPCPWQPQHPTTQGKADLLDLQLAIPLDIEWRSKEVLVSAIVSDGYFSYLALITNGNKHAALAEAALNVAAMVGAKLKETTPC